MCTRCRGSVHNTCERKKSATITRITLGDPRVTVVAKRSCPQAAKGVPVHMRQREDSLGGGMMRWLITARAPSLGTSYTMVSTEREPKLGGRGRMCGWSRANGG